MEKIGIKGHEDGSADNAKFSQPLHLSWIDRRTLVCVDHSNHSIRAVSIGKNENKDQSLFQVTNSTNSFPST
jgi:hypothetical protein